MPEKGGFQKRSAAERAAIITVGGALSAAAIMGIVGPLVVRQIESHGSRTTKVESTQTPPATNPGSPSLPTVTSSEATTSNVALKVVDLGGQSHELKDAYINYSGGFGPSPEKGGIRVLQGGSSSLLPWSQIQRITDWVLLDHKASNGSYVVQARVQLLSGKTAVVTMAEDWSMNPAYGGKGLLLGTTDLGNTTIKFTDIRELTVVK